MQRKVSVSLNDLTHEMIVKQKKAFCVWLTYYNKAK